MALPSSPPITMAQVAAELGVSLPLSLGDSRVRTLAGKPSGNISMLDLLGKSSVTAVINVTYRANYIREENYEEYYEDSAACTVSVPGGTITSATWTIISGAVAYTSTSGFNRTYYGFEYSGYWGDPTSLGIRVRCVVVSNLGTFTVEKDV